MRRDCFHIFGSHIVEFAALQVLPRTSVAHMFRKAFECTFLENEMKLLIFHGAAD